MDNTEHWWRLRAERYVKGFFPHGKVTHVKFYPPDVVKVYKKQKELTNEKSPRVQYEIKQKYSVDMTKPCPVYVQESLFEKEE